MVDLMTKNLNIQLTLKEVQGLVQTDVMGTSTLGIIQFSNITCYFIKRCNNLCEGDSCLVMNIHNSFMHCVMSQYLFKPCDFIMLNNHISITTITYATALPCCVRLNYNTCFTKIHQRNGTNCKFKKSTISIAFGYNMYVIKARTPECVRHDSEMHSTGVTVTIQ